VVVISDWNDEDPDQVLRNLKKDGDYYALKKDAVQSWYKVFKHKALWRRLKQSWTRMGPMDLSDVGYDLFLMNGQPQTKIGDAKRGEKIRLRIINTASSSYFYVEFAGGDMEVVSADGVNVEPFKTQRILMAVAETYDVMVTLPEDKAYELRATSQDGTGYSSGTLGAGELVKAPDTPKLNPETTKRNAMSKLCFAIGFIFYASLVAQFEDKPQTSVFLFALMEANSS